jgi:hypothetical protein
MVSLLGLAACGCPRLDESYASPTDTLLTWQAQLCRDKPVAEYRCMARVFRERIQGFAAYHAWRQQLLAEEPVMSALIKRGNLAGAVADEQLSEDGNHAVLILEVLNTTVTISFERETWATLVDADGEEVVANQRRSLEELIVLRGTEQWLTLERPTLDVAELATLQSVHFDSRWLIAGFGDLPTRTLSE